MGYIGAIWGDTNIGVILGLCWDDGKEMETTIYGLGCKNGGDLNPQLLLFSS